MAIFLLFLSYLLLLLGLSALMVPSIYTAVFAPIGLNPDSSLYRFAMLIALIGLPYLARLVALNDWRAAGYGASRATAWRAIGLGLLIGVAIMLVLTGAQWLLDMRHYAVSPEKQGASHVLRYLMSGLASGLAVGLIEETFFRGLLHTGMRRSLGFWPTALLTSTLYAALHFVKPAPLGDAPFDSARALDMISEGFLRLGDLSGVFDSFVTLVVVGIFLSMVRERTGHILWAIGIHAGGVAIIKLTKFLSDPTRIDGQSSFWLGGYDHITGWMATLWLGAIAVVFWYLGRARTTR